MIEYEPPPRCPECGYEGKVVDALTGLEAWGKNGKCLKCGDDYGPTSVDLECLDADSDDWRGDHHFMENAEEHWAIDLARADGRGPFRRAALARMASRWQGWDAALRAVKRVYGGAAE